MSPRTESRLIAGAFIMLLLATFAAAGFAAHYRETARQIRVQGCKIPPAHLPDLTRRIKA